MDQGHVLPCLSTLLFGVLCVVVDDAVAVKGSLNLRRFCTPRHTPGAKKTHDRGGADPRQPVDNVVWPQDLKQLQLGRNFNQPIRDVVFPSGLLRLDLGDNFNHKIAQVMNQLSRAAVLRAGQDFFVSLPPLLLRAACPPTAVFARKWLFVVRAARTPSDLDHRCIVGRTHRQHYCCVRCPPAVCLRSTTENRAHQALELQMYGATENPRHFSHRHTPLFYVCVLFL